jgi:hypothetical protein
MTKGSKTDKASILKVCRTFHLSFKGMCADEIYDVLMEQLLKAADKYDPHYSDKVAKVVSIIDQKVPGEFSINDLNQYLDFDGARFVRILVRHGFLEAAPGQDGSQREAKNIAGRYGRKTGSWPPPEKYLNSGPIGFTYYLQTWFRYYLQQYIEHARAEIETKEGTYSIDFGGGENDGGIENDVLEARGTIVDHDGAWWEDNSGCDRPKLDLSQMNLEWVQHTDDPLFSDLSRGDRLILYFVFAREYTWEKLGDALQTSPGTVYERKGSMVVLAARRWP